MFGSTGSRLHTIEVRLLRIRELLKGERIRRLSSTSGLRPGPLSEWEDFLRHVSDCERFILNQMSFVGDTERDLGHWKREIRSWRPENRKFESQRISGIIHHTDRVRKLAEEVLAELRGMFSDTTSPTIEDSVQGADHLQKGLGKGIVDVDHAQKQLKHLQNAAQYAASTSSHKVSFNQAIAAEQQLPDANPLSTLPLLFAAILAGIRHIKKRGGREDGVVPE
jgi:hypothetical protein